jgi:hypothetical protein
MTLIKIIFLTLTISLLSCQGRQISSPRAPNADTQPQEGNTASEATCSHFFKEDVRQKTAQRDGVCYFDQSLLKQNNIRFTEEKQGTVNGGTKPYRILKVDEHSAIELTSNELKTLKAATPVTVKETKKPKKSLRLFTKKELLQSCQATCHKEYSSLIKSLQLYACMQECERIQNNGELDEMALFKGYDVQVEAGLIVFGGTTLVECKDSENRQHKTVLTKKCFGLFAGVGASAHSLSGLNGAQCPQGYAGTFIEYSAGVGVASLSGFIGTEDVDHRPLPITEMVTGGGAGIGLSLTPVTLSKCVYAIKSDDF